MIHKTSPGVLIFLLLCCISMPAVNADDASGTEKIFSGGYALGFIKNNGQITDANNSLRPDILYTCETGGLQVFFKQTGFSYVFTQIETPNHLINGEGLHEVLPEKYDVKTQRIDVDFLNTANPDIIAEDPTESYLNYYLPHCSEGILNVPSYRKITYKNIYPFIDIVFFIGIKQGLKYDFVIHPGGNPKDIKMKYQGASSLEVINNELIVKGAFTSLNEQIPKVYQNINGKISDVRCNYIINESVVEFSLASYKKNFPLVIDPWITYLGANGEDRTASINKDPSGNVVISAFSASSAFPATTGAFQVTLSGARDLVIAKFSALGNLLWATYYGGSSNDDPAGICTDVAGNVLVTGATFSANFPVLNPGGGAYFDNTYANLGDVFILKFNGAGVRQWATFIGGASSDYGRDVVCDNAGNIILVGFSSTGAFPTTAGAFQVTKSTGLDGFVTKFNNSGIMQWSTFYGGNNTEYINGVAVNANNDIYITGETFSTNFPTNNMGGGAYFDNTIGGTVDAFVAQLSAAGAQVWSTYLGGPNTDRSYCVAVDPVSGGVAVGGMTFSTTFPTTAGVFQPIYPGAVNYAGFVTVFNNNNSRRWSSFIGGTSQRGYTTGIDFTPFGDVAVTGDTYSTNFPVTSCAYQTTMGPALEGQWIIVAAADGKKLKCSTYLGIGNNSTGHNESSEGLGGTSVVNGCYVYLASHSTCAYPITPGAWQTTCYAAYPQYELVVSRISIETCGNPTPIGIDFSGTTSLCVGQSGSYTPAITVCDTNILTYLWTFSGGTPSTSTARNPSGIIYSTVGAYNVKLVITTPCKKDSLTKTNYTNVTTCGSFSVTSTGQNICAGKCATVSANASGGSSPYTYNWISPAGPGPTGQTVNLCPTQTTTYTIQVSDALGSTSTNSVTITVLNSPSPSIAGNASICPGSSTALTASGGGTYSWNTGSTNAIINVSPTTATTYTLTTSIGSCDSTITYTVTLASPPAANINGPNSICLGSATTLSAAGGSTYSWNTGSTANTINISPTSTSTYTLTSYSGTCVATATHTVSVVNPPTVNISGDDSICPGNNATLSATGGGAYTWSTGASTNVITVTPGANTTYSLTVDSAGCIVNTTHTVALYPLLSPVINGASILCLGDSATLSATGGTTGYVWSTGASTQTIVINPTNNTSYFVTATDINGCVNTTAINITVVPFPLADAGPNDTICPGASASLTASGGGDYVWNTGSTNASISVSPITSTIYSVSVSAGSCVSYDSAYVIISDVTGVNIIGDTAIISGQSGVLTAHTSSTGTYLWNTGETTSNITITPTVSTTYIVTFTDADGCISSDTILITILTCDEIEVFVPNGFSPNGDGQNDVLQLFSQGNLYPFGGAGGGGLYFAIYNRWGEKIFETTDISQAWNGVYKNQDCDTGVYVYLLKYSCATTTDEVVKRGNITLLR